MVTEQMRWILTHTTIDPKHVADIWGVDESECWKFIEDLDREINVIESQRDNIALRDEAYVALQDCAFETKRALLVEKIKKSKDEEEKKKLLIDYKLLTKRISSISQTTIDRARNYPIKDLLGTNKNITHCPFHNDRTASLNIKNNFFHCHGCGVSGDTIRFVMMKENTTFQEAVNRLT